MLDLAKKILTLTKSESKLVFEDLPQDDPKQRKPDINRARQDLGWAPQVDLDEGLILTIEDFKNRI